MSTRTAYIITGTLVLILVGLAIGRGASILVESQQTRHTSIQQAIEELSR